MGHMLYRPGGRVFLATPAYAGVDAGFCFALYESTKLLEEKGISSTLAMFAGDCHVDDSRNHLVNKFLSTDCEQLVFLDADLRWEAKDLEALIRRPEKVIGGTYPLKQEEEGYPVMPLGSLTDGVQEVEAVPTGFLKIEREVLEQMYDAAEKTNKGLPIIFERQTVNGIRWGGDTNFCRKWREMGGKVHLIADFQMEHWGTKRWEGSLRHHLEKESMGAVGACLLAIREERETAQHLADAVKEWSNGWSAHPALLQVAVSMARASKGPVLECGSGLTTLAMAATGQTIYTLEHSKEWAKTLIESADRLLPDSDIKLIQTPLVNGFYALPAIDWPRFGMMLVDGPPRKEGDRQMAQHLLRMVDGPILLDDGMTLPGLNITTLDERINIGYQSDNN